MDTSCLSGTAGTTLKPHGLSPAAGADPAPPLQGSPCQEQFSPGSTGCPVGSFRQLRSSCEQTPPGIPAALWSPAPTGANSGEKEQETAEPVEQLHSCIELCLTFYSYVTLAAWARLWKDALSLMNIRLFKIQLCHITTPITKITILCSAI